MKPKIVSSLDAAIADIPDGARIMFGGFGGAGFPNNLIQALSKKGVKNITAISNNCGTREGELGVMFKNKQVKHVICSFPGPHANYFQEQFSKGEVTCELVPQGILCERMRTAAAGLLGFYTTVGVGTEVALGKEGALAGMNSIFGGGVIWFMGKPRHPPACAMFRHRGVAQRSGMFRQVTRDARDMLSAASRPSSGRPPP